MRALDLGWQYLLGYLRRLQSWKKHVLPLDHAPTGQYQQTLEVLSPIEQLYHSVSPTIHGGLTSQRLIK